MPMASRRRSPSSPASIARPTVAPKPPALAGRKNRIGTREHNPNVAATSTATTTARIRRAPETPPSRSAQPSNAGSAAAIGGEHVKGFAAPRCSNAAGSDRKRVRDKGLGRRTRGLRHAMRFDPLGMRDNLVDDKILQTHLGRGEPREGADVGYVVEPRDRLAQLARPRGAEHRLDQRIEFDG